MRPASSPERPTAYEPNWFTDATISRLTLPTSAMRTMSTVSASVTRSPSTNSGSLPRRCIRSLICGPPPWTTTGFIPTWRISTTSWAKRSASAGSSMACPPYFTTTVLPANSWMYGNASARIAARFIASLTVGGDTPPTATRSACSLTTCPCSRPTQLLRSLRPGVPRPWPLAPRARSTALARSRRAHVLVHIRASEIRERDGGCAGAGVQVGLDGDLALLHARLERVRVVRPGDPVTAHLDTLVGDVDTLWIEPCAARTELREHAPP